MRDLVLIIHNVRSCHNVGAMLRLADGLGVKKVFLTGYTPYPAYDGDTRLPHLTAKLTRQIHKTALGAEETVSWKYEEDISRVIAELKESGHRIAALEQTSTSIPLPKYIAPQSLALIVGREVEGIETEVLAQCDEAVMIPMQGHKESFNVSVAAGIALYSLTCGKNQ